MKPNQRCRLRNDRNHQSELWGHHSQHDIYNIYRLLYTFSPVLSFEPCRKSWIGLFDWNQISKICIFLYTFTFVVKTNSSNIFVIL